jgi:hypothetical protein
MHHGHTKPNKDPEEEVAGLSEVFHKLERQ